MFDIKKANGCRPRIHLIRILTGCVSAAMGIAFGGCGAPSPTEGQTDDSRVEVASVTQQIVSNMVVASSRDDVYVAVEGRGNCSGGLIAQDAILTAAHCLPESLLNDSPNPGGPFSIRVAASRKLAPGVFQCLYSPTSLASTPDACPYYINALAYWDPSWIWQNPDDDDYAGVYWDIAVLKFAWGDAPGRLLNMSDVQFLTGGTMQSFGPAGESTPFDLRYGVYPAGELWHGLVMNSGTQLGAYPVCHGDSGGNLTWGPTVEGVLSWMHTRHVGDLCADGRISFTLVKPKLPLIEGALGRSCPRVNGVGHADCSQPLHPTLLKSDTANVCLTGVPTYTWHGDVTYAPCSSSSNAQKWVLDMAPNGLYRVYSVQDGMCLTPYLYPGWSTVSVGLDPCTEEGQWAWYTDPSGSGHQRLANPQYGCLGEDSAGVLHVSPCELQTGQHGLVEVPGWVRADTLASSFAVYGTESVKINDRATVVTVNLGPMAVASSGEVEVGAEGKVGMVQANVSATLRDRATVDGDVYSPVVTRGNGVVVTGVEYPTAQLPTPDLTLDVSFDGLASCGTKTVESGQSFTPVKDCLYQDIMVRANGSLVLERGAYFVANLTMDSGSSLGMTPDPGSTQLYVRNSLIYRANGNTRPGDFLLYTPAAGNVPVSGLFLGTLIAPNAAIVVDMAGLAQVGAFLGRSVELHQGQWVKHLPYAHPYPL